MKLPIASVEDDSSSLASSKSDDSMSQNRSSQNYMPLLSSTSADEPNCPSTSTDASVQHHEDTIQSSSGEDQDVQHHSEDQITKSTSSLYKLVFDNIDKSVKPRYMRSIVQTKSLHYVHMYCVKDRIDFSGLSQVPKSIDVDDSLYSILPSDKDYNCLKQNFDFLIAKTIHGHVHFFGEDFKRLIPTHVPHQYTNQMTQVRSGKQTHYP